MEHRQNWAGNYTYKAARLHRPATAAQVQEMVAAHSKVKALGSRHSFNDIADTSEDLISLEHFAPVVQIDYDQRTVTVDGGLR